MRVRCFVGGPATLRHLGVSYTSVIKPGLLARRVSCKSKYWYFALRRSVSSWFFSGKYQNTCATLHSTTANKKISKQSKKLANNQKKLTTTDFVGLLLLVETRVTALGAPYHVIHWLKHILVALHTTVKA